MGKRTLEVLTLALVFSCGPDCGESGYPPRSYAETLEEWAGPPSFADALERALTAQRHGLVS